MAAETVVIDVVAKFSDQVTSKSKKAQQSVDKLESSVSKIGKKKAAVHIGVKDKASSGLKKVLSSANSFAKKTFKSTIAMADKASSVVNSATNKARSFASKTWKTTLSVVDRFTSPLTKLKNMLFNINTLIAAVATGLATKLIVANPVSMADSITTSTIFFETKLGSTDAANKMMSDIMNFAKNTPFDTSGVISSVQQMMAYGIETENVLDYMEKIGNVSAAMGKGEEGIDAITRALGQMKAAGRVNAQDMMQLTSVGVTGWQYIADGMGLSVAEVRKLSEEGELAADEAIKHIMKGLEEYDGMMDKMSNRTVSGIVSNLKDAFDQSIVLKWGEGLQKGAVNGLQDVKTWLDRIDPLLQNAGTSLSELGEALSTKAFDLLGSLMNRAELSIRSPEFQEADLGGKIKILWDDVIWTPFTEWWNNKGKPKLAEKMREFGYSLGKGISNGLLAILGFDVYDSIDEGASIGASFGKGFAEGFDGEAVGEAIINALKKAFAKGSEGLIDLLLPGDQGASASSKLMGILMGYGGLKLAGGVGKLISGVSSATSTLSTFGANTAIKLGAGNLAGNASLGAGALSGIGLVSTTGGIVGGATLIKGGTDLYRSYKAFKSGDEIEGKANLASGGTAIGGVAAGAAAGAVAGSFIPVIGTAAGALIGAGIGGLAGWIGGEKWADSIREVKVNAEAAKYESQEMKEAIKDSSLSAEELNAVFEQAVRQNAADHFGDIALSLEEINTLAKRYTFADKEKEFVSFSNATADVSAKLSGLQNATESLNKLNWKASLGFELSESEQESYTAAIDSLIASAQEYLESNNYELTCAVSLLLGSDSAEGKAITDSSDAFYAKLQEELNSLGEELSDKVEIALKDGVISLDEQAEITSLQQQIADITNKLAEAEFDASMEMIKLKFGDSTLDSDSFAELQSQLGLQLESAIASYDEALKVSLTGLNLQLNEGAITQEQYDEQVAALMEGYKANISEMTAKVHNIQFELLGDAYSSELGEDAAGKLQSALDKAISFAGEPITWSQDKLEQYLNVDSLSAEAATVLTNALQLMYDSIPDSAMSTVAESAQERLQNAWSTTFENFNEKYALPEGFYNGLEADIEAGLADLEVSIPSGSYTGVTTSIETALSPNIEAVDVSGPVATMKSNCDTTLQTTMSEGVTVDYPVTINPYLTKSYFNLNAEPSLAGNNVQFSITNNATGGFANSRTLSWLGEEGYPESIIPLAPHRRKSAMSLWEKTGEMLGVKPAYNALGGIVGGTYSETTSNSAPSASYSSGSPGNIQLTIGNITFEIKSGDNPTDILAAIKAQKEAIVDVVSESLYEALLRQFENTPMAVR